MNTKTHEQNGVGKFYLIPGQSHLVEVERLEGSKGGKEWMWVCWNGHVCVLTARETIEWLPEGSKGGGQSV